MTVDEAMEWAEAYARTHHSHREHDDSSMAACVLSTEVHRLRAANVRTQRQSAEKLAHISAALKAMDGSCVLPEPVAKAVLVISQAVHGES